MWGEQTTVMAQSKYRKASVCWERKRYFIAYHSAEFSVQSCIQFFSLLRHIVPQIQLRYSRHDPPHTYLLFISPEKCKQFNSTITTQAGFSLLLSKSEIITLNFNSITDFSDLGILLFWRKLWDLVSQNYCKTFPNRPHISHTRQLKKLTRGVPG